MVVKKGGNSIAPFSAGSKTKFDLDSFHSQEEQGYLKITEAGATQKYRLAASPSLTTLLPNSSVDPFFKAPIHLSTQELEAVDHSKCLIKNFPQW
jgi:hypothetical protein